MPRILAVLRDFECECGKRENTTTPRIMMAFLCHTVNRYMCTRKNE